MSLPPPPWESHPPLPEDEFYQGDPDEDTGPLYIGAPDESDADDVQADGEEAAVAVEADSGDWVQTYHPTHYDEANAGEPEAPDSGHWPEDYRPAPPDGESVASRFAAPLTVDPRTVPVKHESVRVWPIVAGVAGVVAVGLAAWLFWPSSDAQEAAGTDPPPSTQNPVDGAAQAKLLRLLPPGYPSSACEQVEPPEGALAQVDCAQNADTDGPPSATYTLLRDKPTLQGAFDEAVRETAVVNCPNNIQSPGPWRRNATPQQVSGTLVCGLQQSRPTLAWTDDIVSLLGVVRAVPEGPSLDQLYAWWSTHS
jgi:hypothetical protein